MRVAIIGAGIGGVTAAWELAQRGHTVTVFERRQAVAAEGSFALPGLLASLAPMPWCLPRGAAARGAGRLAAGWRPGWAWQHWRAGAAPRAARRAAALHALAALGAGRIEQASAQLQPELEASDGALLLWRDARALDRGRRALAQHGPAAEWQWLDDAACRRLEPHLAPELPLAGGLRLPGGGAANGRQWAQQLKTAAQAQGVRFLLDTEVLRVQPGAPVQLSTARASDDSLPPAAQRETTTHETDAIVLSAGAGSRPLLAAAGLRLPLRAVTSFSVTAPLGLPDAHELGGPHGAVLDMASGISIARLGQRLRVGGLQCLGDHGQRRLGWAGGVLHRALEQHFPGGGVTWRSQTWAGLAARLPDGAPVVGKTSLPGVWLHTGHGACGWALGWGSAAVLADLLDGRPVPDALQWLGCERLR